MEWRKNKVEANKSLRGHFSSHFSPSPCTDPRPHGIRVRSLRYRTFDLIAITPCSLLSRPKHAQSHLSVPFRQGRGFSSTPPPSLSPPPPPPLPPRQINRESTKPCCRKTRLLCACVCVCLPPLCLSHTLTHIHTRTRKGE